MNERTDKILANLGYCTRREAPEYLRTHVVLYHSARVKNVAQKVARDEITIDGLPPDHPDGIFIVLNKPAGYICSHDVSEGRRVYDLLPDQWMRRNPLPSTVGRLDKDTTGVIVITDISRLNHKLSSSKKMVEKVYEVSLDRPLNVDLEKEFASGTLTLAGESTPCKPAILRQTGAVTAEVILTEGRYHQVKRMFGYFGFTVVGLHRSRFGPFSVKSVSEGAFEDLAISSLSFL